MEETKPWDNAPENVIFYERIYEDGHIGNHTQSPMLAYQMGLLDNYISLDDVEESEIDEKLYIKEKCPHKTQEDYARDNAILRIAELKKFLADTDYKAIKFAEGALTIVEYESDRVARADARREINELEELL